MFEVNEPVADLGGALLSIQCLFIFIQFSAKIMPKNKLVPPLWVGTPLGKPGSANVNLYLIPKVPSMRALVEIT